MLSKVFISIIIFLGIGLAALATFVYFSKKHQVPVYVPATVLNSLWYQYKQNFIEAESGRVIDTGRGGITTSEGQSYALLRAVWEDDKEAFDKSFAFTRDNLDRPDDHLFAWKFGERGDGTYGILEDEGGGNSATDADTDIALALVFAYKRWQEKSYLEAALPLIDDIWEKQVITINGRPYLAANNLEQASPDAILINPSYYAPYAYRIFAQLDRTHPWDTLVDASYTTLEESLTAPLDTGGGVGIPPDWVVVNRKTGTLSTPQDPALTTRYSYDALRLPWRLALDATWYRESRAIELLKQMKFFSEEWQKKQKLAASYTHDGTVVEEYETPASYGGSMGYFLIVRPQEAKEIYASKLIPLYNLTTFSWHKPLSYYDDNWAWFGLALYFGELPNLAQDLIL